jgi:hypothetical protein
MVKVQVPMRGGLQPTGINKALLRATKLLGVHGYQ